MLLERWVWPSLYACWALPLILLLVAIQPPFLNPDEAAHFARIVQIQQGGIVGYRFSIKGDPPAVTAGGRSDAGILKAEAPFVPLIGQTDRRLSPSMLSESSKAVFSRYTELPFPNSAIYPPTFYVAQAISVFVYKYFFHNIDGALYVSRFLSGLTALILTVMALRIAHRCRPAILAIAMLPMTLSLDGSAAQDGQMLACILIEIALIDRVQATGRHLSSCQLYLATTLLAFIGMARPPYAPLAVLLTMMVPYKRGVIAASVALAVAACWSIIMSHVAGVTYSTTVPAEQFRSIVTHPIAFAAILAHTFYIHWQYYWRETIGILGYADITLPEWYINSAMICVVICFTSTMTTTARLDIRPLMSLALVILAIFVSIYIIWDAPNAPSVENAGGRYFVPLIGVVAVGLPALPRCCLPSQRVTSAVSLAFLALVTPTIMVYSIIQKYYLSAAI